MGIQAEAEMMMKGNCSRKDHAGTRTVHCIEKRNEIGHFRVDLEKSLKTVYAHSGISTKSEIFRFDGGNDN